MEELPNEKGPLAPVMAKLGAWRAGSNPFVSVPDENGRVAGFWLGVWHGVIAPVTAIRSLFSQDVHVFEVHNSGNGYIFGFLLGVLLWAGGGRAGGPRRKA